MLKIDPKEVSTAKLHGYMLGAIAPRPIAFASTMDAEGNANLAPYSFFNAFGSNPTTLIFSPARRVRDNTIKHTLENVQANKEVVINVVTYDMVQQTSLASTEYAAGVDEFVKSGLTKLESERVKPYRVKESPVQFECKVREVIETGTEGGAGNLIVCEILVMHVSESILDENKRIDQHKIDLVGRMGQNWYVRASGSALFEVAKPIANKGMGVDQLPETIKLSKVLTGNNLGQLGNVETLPTQAAINAAKAQSNIKEMLDRYAHDSETLTYYLHMEAKRLLDEGKVEAAWSVLLASK